MRHLAAIVFTAMLLLISVEARAHVDLTYPIGGETFDAGETITITWFETIPHGAADWDLYYSLDSGYTWEPIALDLDHSLDSYQWTVVSAGSDLARIKVTQDNHEYPTDFNGYSEVFTIAGIGAPGLTMAGAGILVLVIGLSSLVLLHFRRVQRRPYARVRVKEQDSR